MIPLFLKPFFSIANKVINTITSSWWKHTVFKVLYYVARNKYCIKIKERNQKQTMLYSIDVLVLVLIFQEPFKLPHLFPLPALSTRKEMPLFARHHSVVCARVRPCRDGSAQSTQVSDPLPVPSGDDVRFFRWTVTVTLGQRRKSTLRNSAQTA